MVSRIGLSYLKSIQDFIWGPPLLGLLLGTGAYYMILLRGLPIRRLGWAISEVLHAGGETAGEERNGKMSSFSSLATELAATIGTGNIIGVVSAIVLGGPGAIWWMLLSSFLGLATKLAESSLSVKYRRETDQGDYMGGPMVTLEDAFPNPGIGKVLAVFYAVLAVFCALGMGNMVQANTVSEALVSSVGISKTLSGWILALLVMIVVLGGAKTISRIATYLVPAMGAVYLAGCLGILLTHWQNILPALFGSLQAAVSPKAAGGGLFGTVTVTFFDSVRWGVSRGVFSNESGLGASGISAAAAQEKQPVKQGYISMTGVFFDTMVICIVTGLAFCCSNVMKAAGEGDLYLQSGRQIAPDDPAGLMIAAFESTYGRYGAILLGVCISLFAFATILGWGYQGEQTFHYLFGGRAVPFFRFAYGFFAFLGSVLTLESVWAFSDICNGLLAIPNLICILALSPEICKDIVGFSQ